ncbi:ribonuclease HI [Leucobacter sp. HNU]|uniref:ribonuclease HI n=1 Tax=Leucobacter sp. HNU TaxID=3236805 RepID=UPI003A80CEF4
MAAEEEDVQIHLGRTAGTEPAALIAAELECALSDVQGPVWVTVPKERRGLAATLRRSGYVVTAGLGRGSRAEPELREQIAAQSRLLLIEATKADAVGPSSRVKKVGLPEPSDQVYWLPSERRIVDHAGLDVLHIAADASLESVAYSRLYAACAVSDRGDCILTAEFTQGHSGEVEFIALLQALEIVAGTAPQTAVISSDSKHALEIIRWLTHGAYHKALLGGGRVLSEEYCTRFRDVWRRARARTEVTFQHVLGHASHPLNEAADSIARFARRAATRPAREGEHALSEHLEKALGVLGASRGS